MAALINTSTTTQAEMQQPAIQPPAIAFQDVSFSYRPDRVLIDQLSTKIQQGCVTSIIGPNGSGKSTLVKLANGLIKPQRGTVSVAGQNVGHMSAKLRAQTMAVLAQSMRVPQMSVEALVACGRHSHQSFRGAPSEHDKAAVERALQLAGVEDIRTSQMASLSGGQRQRAFLAMTLAQETDLILLDEPTTYLDIRACHDLMELICTLNKTQQKTIVMVIHDLDLALRYSDRLLVMDKGTLLGEGTTADVMASGVIERAFSMEICPHSYRGEQGYVLYPFEG